MKGSFVVFEGVDGCGKGEQIAQLNKFLLGRGFECYLTKEPTDSKVGALIKSILKGEVKASNMAIQLLMCADRLEHSKDITTKIGEGCVVICDRYHLSSVAYGSVFENADKYNILLELNKYMLKPDITFIIDVPVDVAMQRIETRGGKKELFEKAEFLTQVRKNYLRIMKEVDECVHIDGSRDVKDVHEEILHHMRMKFNIPELF